MRIIVALIVLAGLAVAALAIWARGVEPGEDRLARPGDTPATGDHPAEGGFTAVREVADAEDALRRLDEVAAVSPRTERRAGSVADGHVVYVTRSRVFGFPDVTHLWREGGRVALSGHLVIGKGDMGVNRDRILGWLARAGL